ncbi:MAG: S53 family peptidase, partial [Janthinobacterium lividum]
MRQPASVTISASLGVALATGLVGIAPANAATLSLVGRAAASRPVEFNVVLPLRNAAELNTLIGQMHDNTSPMFHHWLTPQQYAERFGPDAATVASVTKSFQARGLTVVPGTRSLHVSGTAANVGSALNTSLAIGALPNGHQHLVATSALTMPAEATQAGAFVVDFASAVNVMHPLSRRANVAPVPFSAPSNRTSTTGGYWYGDLKQAYQYPSYQTFITKNGKKQRLDGTGTTIGILMSSDVFDSDIDAVFNHEHFMANSGQASNPKLFKRVYVDGGATTDSGALDEVELDTQEALTGAPGSHVILYDIPDLSDQSIIDGYTKIIDDNESDIVSSSFGGCELPYAESAQILQYEHELYVQGNAQGISFLASSGDEAGLECPSENYVDNGTPGVFVPSVSAPASDPNVTAVGGTNVVTKHTAGSLDSSYVNENAYSDPEIAYDIYGEGSNVSGGAWGPGGGLSTVFKKPSYQYLTNTGSNTARTLPDIGMQVGGCPGGIAALPCNGGNNPLDGSGNTDRSYVIVAIEGAFYGLIGTSVSSPELAGATAMLIEQYGRMGNLNYYIYGLGALQSVLGNNPKLPTTAFHRGIPGYNGVVTNRVPGPNYNYTTGNGTPIVYHYVAA